MYRVLSQYVHVHIDSVPTFRHEQNIYVSVYELYCFVLFCRIPLQPRHLSSRIAVNLLHKFVYIVLQTSGARGIGNASANCQNYLI